MAYETTDQFLELMSLLKAMGDQIRSVRVSEPPNLCLQDLVDRPFALRGLSEGGKHASKMEYASWQQLRILDLDACLRKTRLPGESLRFNLQLEDPIWKYLDENDGWDGIGGDYIVTLGPESDTTRGQDDSLPTLRADVGTFTRLWLGVRNAPSLTCTANLDGPEELLQDLERVLRLPTPQFDWNF
jgi:hypothetical protein